MATRKKSWQFPPYGFVKVNVHAIFYEKKLPNGNNSGIGIVIRNHEGIIIKMVSGSIPGLTKRSNELWAIMAGLRSAFYEGKKRMYLESDNEEGLKEWEEYQWFTDPNHADLIHSLQQRKNDPNCVTKVDGVDFDRNGLARFLAVDGAHNRKRMVVFRKMFGRVRELWQWDMGLGPVEARFEEIEEEQYVQNAEEDIFMETTANMLMQ